MSASTLYRRTRSQAIPENRRGTRTARRYALFYGATRTQASATQRQLRKAYQLADHGVHHHRVTGRVLRHLVRKVWEDFTERADERFHG